MVRYLDPYIGAPLTRPVYSVRDAAALIGVTTGRIYQLLKASSERPLPTDSKYLRPATRAELIGWGLNTDIITGPSVWVPASEIERFRSLRRRKVAVIHARAACRERLQFSVTTGVFLTGGHQGGYDRYTLRPTKEG